jgi:hypothetical protein
MHVWMQLDGFNLGFIDIYCLFVVMIFLDKATTTIELFSICYKIHWDCLCGVMERMNFSTQWVDNDLVGQMISWKILCQDYSLVLYLFWRAKYPQQKNESKLCKAFFSFDKEDELRWYGGMHFFHCLYLLDCFI